MARTALTATSVTQDGVTQASTPGTADGYKFTNDGRVMVRVTNTNLTTTLAITIPTFRQVDGLDVASSGRTRAPRQMQAGDYRL